MSVTATVVRTGMSASANAITAAILLGVSERFRGQIVLWRNNRIDAMVKGRGGKMRRVTAGINGQADLTGIMASTGRRIEIEVKAGKDRQSPEQCAFGLMIQKHGGLYLVARDAEQCLWHLQNILDGMLAQWRSAAEQYNGHEVDGQICCCDRCLELIRLLAEAHA